MRLENNCRDFLLGLSDEETERRIEEGILANSFDIDELRLVEDELIDDYLLGRLSPTEEHGFTTHFLSVADRRQKLDFARALTSYATQVAGEGSEVAEPVRRRGKLPRLGWRAAAAVAFAASVILAVLSGLENERLRREIEIVRGKQGEVSRLEAALAAQNSKQLRTSPGTGTELASSTKSGTVGEVGSIPWVELSPDKRKVQPMKVLRIPAHAQVVRIIFDHPETPGGRFWGQLKDEKGNTFWMQEFVASGARSGFKSMFVLPTSVLTQKRYTLFLKNTLTEDDSQAWVTYQFLVDQH